MIGRFDGGRITTDGGGLLLRETDRRIGLLDRLAGCFTDHRDAQSMEHDVHSLVAQRVYAVALGYEDLNDHDVLSDDSTLAVFVIGAGRWRVRARNSDHALECRFIREWILPLHFHPPRTPPTGPSTVFVSQRGRF